MDAFLILVFVLVSLTVPVLLLALLLYAIPVRAAVTVILKGKQQEQVLVISWGLCGVRTSGTGTGRLTEVLIAGHAVFSHTGSLEQDEPGGEETGTGEGEIGKVPGGERVAVRPSAMTGRQPAGSVLPPPPPAGPLQSGSSAAVKPDKKNPVAGAHAAESPAPVSPDIGEIVHLIQKMTGPVGSFFSVFWQQSSFVSASGTVTLGLGDPVLTGEVCGMYWASRFALLASRISVELEPVFDRAVLELDITVRVKMKHPLLVLLAGFRLVWQPAMRNVIGSAMRQSRGAAPA